MEAEAEAEERQDVRASVRSYVAVVKRHSDALFSEGAAVVADASGTDAQLHRMYQALQAFDGACDELVKFLEGYERHLALREGVLGPVDGSKAAGEGSAFERYRSAVERFDALRLVLAGGDAGQGDGGEGADAGGRERDEKDDQF